MEETYMAMPCYNDKCPRFMTLKNNICSIYHCAGRRMYSTKYFMDSDDEITIDDVDVKFKRLGDDDV